LRNVPRYTLKRMSSTWRPAPQRLMKTGSIGSMLSEACGPEVFDLTGA
jgi:hypothetical protein